MTRKDWLIQALDLAADGLTPVQLQKSLFILGAELPRSVGRNFYKFEPYNYGPYDSTIYHDADAMAVEGHVEISSPLMSSVRLYQITPSGRELADAKREALDRVGVEYLSKVVGWVEKLSFRDLVEAVYARYPEQRVNSVFES